MQCEGAIEKLSRNGCNGPFCQPDGFDAYRIAQNFTGYELDDRISQVLEKLNEKPVSCDLQHAFNQLAMARQMKGDST